MKRFVMLWVTMFACAIAFAQTIDFYGLKFGEKYSQEQVVAAVGDNGAFVAREEHPETFNFICYRFESLLFNGQRYDGAGVMFNPQGIFAALVFSTTNKSTSDLQAYFDNQKVFYDAKYLPAPEYKQSMGAVFNGIIEFYLDGESQMIVLGKQSDETSGEYVTESFWSVECLLEVINEQVRKLRPEIQDTFFGLKIGSKVTETAIKNAVYSKGTYLNSDTVSMGREVCFTDTRYAGVIWDYVTFTIAPTGEFYVFRAYNHYKDFGYDDKKEASDSYTNMKNRLDEKYGEGREVTDGDDLVVYYEGSNGITIILDSTRSKSSGGDYFRYVSTAYIDFEIWNAISAAGNDEL